MRYFSFLRDEVTALLANKYQIKTTFQIFEDKFEWRIIKPNFYLQIYSPKEVPTYQTIFVAEFAWIKITRKA